MNPRFQNSAPTPMSEGDAFREVMTGYFPGWEHLANPTRVENFLSDRRDPSVRYASDVQEEMDADDEYPNDAGLDDNDFSFVYIGELGFHLQSDWIPVFRSDRR